MALDMPASYEGDALGGSKKVGSVNQVMRKLLLRGTTMQELQTSLVKVGKAPTAARAHLAFLHKNRVELFVNGRPYSKGQVIAPNDLITLE